MMDSFKAGLFVEALGPAHREELETALGAWTEPTEEDFVEFLDFFALSWVDAEGFTLAEREQEGSPEPWLRRLLMQQRHGLYVVDAMEGGRASVRDVLSEESLVLEVDTPLAPRTVLRGRLLPLEDGSFRPTGAPDLFEDMRVIARMDLAREWEYGEQKALLDRMAALREAFVFQREQRIAFLACFETDEFLADTPQMLEEALGAFLSFLLERFQPRGLAGQTYRQHFADLHGREPPEVRLELDENLRRSGRVGVIFDSQEGLHLLPSYGDFRDHLRGEGDHPEVLKAYLEDPGITALPFQRVGRSEVLAAHLDRSGESLEAMLSTCKPRPSRMSPSLFPGFE
jgi:hypothetical protein